jgi:ANTAR domain
MTPELIALGAALRAALVAGDDAAALSRVCTTLTEALPCEAAVVTIMLSDLERHTVFASDETIRAFELAQYTVGEGPSLLAFTSGRPVTIPDTSAAWTASWWPTLTREVAHLPMASVFCFPMQLGAIDIGVCSLYRSSTGEMNAKDVSIVVDALELATLVLLQLRGHDHHESLVGRWLAVDGHSRRTVHQAIGMLMVQLRVSSETAFARLRAQSFVADRDIEQVADDVVNRGLQLTNDAH